MRVMSFVKLLLAAVALFIIMVVLVSTLPAQSTLEQSQTSYGEGDAVVGAADTSTTPVIFVGNNWDGMIDVIDAETYTHIGVINGIPDKAERMSAIRRSPFRFFFFYLNRFFVGDYANLFAPLTGKYRECMYACICALNEALNGPDTDYRTNLVRQDIIDIFVDATCDVPILDADGDLDDSRLVGNELARLLLSSVGV